MTGTESLFQQAAKRLMGLEAEGIQVADPLIVTGQVQPDETVLVILDSNHTYAHVASELEAYADLVTPGSYIVATDGIMYDLADVPRGQAEWATDNPT